jgi:hypothetical protein
MVKIEVGAPLMDSVNLLRWYATVLIRPYPSNPRGAHGMSDHLFFKSKNKNGVFSGFLIGGNKLIYLSDQKFSGNIFSGKTLIFYHRIKIDLFWF